MSKPPLKRTVVLAIILLGMLTGRQLCPGLNLLRFRHAAEAYILRRPAFVMSPSWGHHRVEGSYRGGKGSPRANEGKRFLCNGTEQGHGLSNQNGVLQGQFASGDLDRRRMRRGSCSLHSSSDMECGGRMGHIEERLIRMASTKGSRNQLAAVRSLKRIIENDPRSIPHLLRHNIVEVFTKVLKQLHSKNFWELMNSYIWSQSHTDYGRLKMIQDTVLAALIMLSRYNEAISQQMANDDNFKRLLLRIYLCELKRQKDMKQGSFQPAITSTTSHETVGSATPGDSTTEAPQIVDQDNVQKKNEKLHNGLGLVQHELSMDEACLCRDTQALVRELFHSFGYRINENSVMEKYERAMENNGESAKDLADTGILIDEGDGEGEYTASILPHNISQCTSEDSDSVNDPPVIWVPYMIRKTAGNVVDSIRRHLHITLGEKVGEIVNLDAIEDATVDYTEDYPEDVLFGMVALSSTAKVSEGALKQMSVTREGKSAGEAGTKELDREKYHCYRVISNIKMATSEHINGVTMANSLLKKLHTVRSVPVLNDIVHELWTLVRSKDKEVTELVGEKLDLSDVADIIMLSLEQTKPEELQVTEAKEAHVPNAFMRMIVGLKSQFSSYILTILSSRQAKVAEPQGKGAEEARAHDGKVPTPESVSEISNGIDIPNPQVANQQLARQLQTAIFGLLIDLIYLNGNAILASIRECVPLVEALKKTKSTLPSLLPIVDVIENGYKGLTSLLDKRMYDGSKETQVIHNEDKCTAIYNTDELLLRERDEFGTVASRFEEWVEESWMRQKCISKESLGAFFNCHKLLNILGHHDQERFKNRGLRILCIDGGGTKGVVALETLRQLEKSLGKGLHESFDIICGTSCGGLLGALIALEKARVVDIQKMFESMIEKVFTRDSYRVTGTRLLMRYAYYDEGVLYDNLRNCFGNMELIDYSVDPTCPKFFCLSVKMNSPLMQPIVWRNYNYPPEALASLDSESHTRPRDGSFAIKTVDAIRATTAAPLYFPMLERSGNLFGDGALHANNPSLIALLEAKMIYPNVPIDCLVSVGNGILSDISVKSKATEALAKGPKKTQSDLSEGNYQQSGTDKDRTDYVSASTTDEKPLNGTLDIKDVLLRSLHMPMTSDPKSLGLEQLINHIVSAATNTEMVHLSLQTLMDGKKYFRLNPKIPNVRLDDTRPEVLSDLKERTKRYLEEEIQVKRIATITELLKGDR